MSEETDSSSKRKLSRLSVLRRKADSSKVQDEATVGDNIRVKSHNAKSVLPTISASQPATNPTNPTSPLGRLTSPSAATMAALNAPDKTSSLESSVRKFRIVEALRKGDSAWISRVLNEGAEGGSRTSISSLAAIIPRLEDTTILHLAIQCADIPIVQQILTEGAGSIDVNARDKDGNTPLHLAVQQGRTPVVKMLLEQPDINDTIVNFAGRTPLDLARNPEIHQQLHLSRSIFAEEKLRQVQSLITSEDYLTLGSVLEEARLKTVLDVNSPDFVSESVTQQSGGTLLHEAARKKDIKLIEVLLLHGADPFRRDRKGKLPQDVTKDDAVRGVLKKSPAAVAAQRGIQEKAVLGQAAGQGGVATSPSDPLAGRESREMMGYLKKWTNYRKGYQLRWFVLEGGVLSYYKHQDDAGSACRGAINMRIAKLHMSADEKTKFEIQGKSSVKYSLKANHEVEAKRWFWALNNSIQWSKDQAKEEERQRNRSAELLQQAKAEVMATTGVPLADGASENAAVPERRKSTFVPQGSPNTTPSTAARAAMSSRASADQDDHDMALKRVPGSVTAGGFDDDDDEGDDSSVIADSVATKDAFNITAQSAKLQLDILSQVSKALVAESAKTPDATLSTPKVKQALNAYDAALTSLSDLVEDLSRISKDRDAHWQSRLNRETEMRRMWEDSMAKVAKEQEALEARVGEAEHRRKLTKRALKEVLGESRQDSSIGMNHQHGGSVPITAAVTAAGAAGLAAGVTFAADTDSGVHSDRRADAPLLARKQSALQQMELSESGSEDDDEEFFDAVDAGEVAVAQVMPEEQSSPAEEAETAEEAKSDVGTDISASYKGYENGIRTKLKLQADNRPQISLWGILKSMIGKDMTKMTLPVTFNEPTSLLYRCGEDMEYADLLDLAVKRQDSIERLVYVAAFAASEYASTIGRVAKPFNPLLGETFEYVRPDKGYRFFIEQVSHHPPIGAAFAESSNWQYWGESAVKSKFYGKSFDINPLGTWFLRIRPAHGGPDDFYTWKKVTSSVIGIITGTPAVDNYGLMEIKNWTTGEVAHVDFKQRGWKASSAFLISGKIVDGTGRTRISLGGRWNSKLYARLTPGFEKTPDEPRTKTIHTGGITDPSQAYLIWQAHERPEGIPFNLTPFVLTFNHIDDKLRPWLAPTDSRLRPDQRAMEEGNYDFAATEKNRLEELQRARRREREAKGEEFTPAWFTKELCEITGEEYWKFNGQYWARRERAGNGDASAWAGLEPIFGDA